MLEFVGKDPFRVVGKVQGFVTTERWFGGIWLGKSVDSNENVVMRENGLVVRQMDRDLKAERLTHGEHLSRLVVTMRLCGLRRTPAQVVCSTRFGKCWR